MVDLYNAMLFVLQQEAVSETPSSNVRLQFPSLQIILSLLISNSPFSLVQIFKVVLLTLIKMLRNRHVLVGLDIGRLAHLAVRLFSPLEPVRISFIFSFLFAEYSSFFLPSEGSQRRKFGVGIPSDGCAGGLSLADVVGACEGPRQHVCLCYQRTLAQHFRTVPQQNHCKLEIFLLFFSFFFAWF
jgi:hypothetical protein